MSTLLFLATELQALASETRRKHPEIREAAEKSIAVLKSHPEQGPASLAQDGPYSQEVLKPIFMGCSTKTAKVVAISLGSLQRLISLKAVPQSTIPSIVTLLGDSITQGVDIQLKVLQTLLSLLTNYRDVHDELLGDALLLCFRLQESRIAVVSSTAAATLRQLVMFVFDKVMEADKAGDTPADTAKPVELPDGQLVTLHPSARDAFSVFEDLCLLANSEEPNFLKLEHLPKTFALELIESVLTNYHDLFRKRSELLMLLQHHLCPLLLKSLSDKPFFPLILRSTRVVFLLLKQFSIELATEAEVFLILLVKVISGDGDYLGGPSLAGDASGSRPPWMRVLAMEIIRGICSDAELMRGIWDRYDAKTSTGSQVYTTLISALKRLVMEKPALLGTSPQMQGVGVTAQQADHVSSPHSTAAYGLEVAGRVASAATATVSNVVGMMGSEVGLSLSGSTMKLQCIDQLDKADAPAIPESYIYLLALQSLVTLAEGFASVTFPLYTSIVMQRPRPAGETTMRAPPALDVSTLPPAELSTKQLITIKAMVESGWPGLLSALSFLIGTNLAEDLFGDVLTAFQHLTNVSGILDLTTPRDAFLMSLSKFAIPPGVVSSVDSYMEPATPKTASMSDALGLTGGVTQAPGLSERNVACLKVIISTALFLSGTLGSTWFDVLELLQNADYVFSLRGLRGPGSTKRQPSLQVPAQGARPAKGNPPPTPSSQTQQPAPRHPLMVDLDVDSVQTLIARLFESSKSLDEVAFRDFVVALCKLSGEMVGMQSTARTGDQIRPSDSMDELMAAQTLLAPASPSIGMARQRRRVSGLSISKTLRSGDYGITRLGTVALLNINRLICRDPEIAWNTVTSHLLSVLSNATAPSSIRQQAAEVLDEIVVIVPRNLSTAPEPLQAQIQKQVLDVLSQQVAIGDGGGYGNVAVVVEIKRLALETLHKILQSSGHTLVVGWETIFEMLGSVAQPSSAIQEGGFPTSPSVEMSTPTLNLLTPGKGRPSALQAPKGSVVLVRIAFQSLALVCDSLDSLSPDHLRLCIKTLGQFGRQEETNIALTAAESLLWGVSDSIQAKRKDVEKEPEYSALWTFLLLELSGLCTDARHVVRIGAIQTLFRTLQLYGATLSLETWEECLWKVIFPLLDNLTLALKQATELGDAEEPTSVAPSMDIDQSKNPWDESKTLALQSVGSILNDFLVSKIMYLASFGRAWDAFLDHVKGAMLSESRKISTAALRCLERALQASRSVGPDLRVIAGSSWERTWNACDEMGGAILLRPGSQPPASQNETGRPTSALPFTQESLQAFVNVLQSVYSLNGSSWDLARLKALLAILKGVMTYQYSTDYRPDIDTLTPVQAAVLRTLQSVQLSLPGAPSLVLSDVAEYSTLAFLAAFDYEEPPIPGVNPDKKGNKKRVTYISLAKQTMPLLVELFLKYKDLLDIYVDGTLERVLSAYAIPIRLKYDAPAPSKFGSDPPLWKTATSNFLKIVSECGAQIEGFQADLLADRVEGIWRHVLNVFKGGLLADCSFVETLPRDVQEKEEDFDLQLVKALELNVVPYLGDSRVPDYLIIQLGKTLQIASRLHDLDIFRSPPSDGPSGDANNKVASAPPHTKPTPKGMAYSKEFDSFGAKSLYGTTATGKVLPRERFSYWCFDLLFLICSNHFKEPEEARKRVAALILPSLLSRCHIVLASYIADYPLRGLSPMPRVQEEELLYILRKLLALQLWPGSLWAALSDSPSKHSISQPDSSPAERGPNQIADTMRRSSRAAIFHFYGILCDIVSLPGKPASMWIAPSHAEELTMWGLPQPPAGPTNLKAVEIDARCLAKMSLKVIGQEIGAGMH